MRLAYTVPVSRSNGQRSESPGPLMLTHIVRHIFRMARPKNFKLGIRREDDESHQSQAPWLLRSKVKVARSCDQSEPSWPNALPVSLEAGGGIPCRRTRRPHFLFPATLNTQHVQQVLSANYAQSVSVLSVRNICVFVFVSWQHYG